nr:MAG TPA: hypothetical protein [Caudoviricetes sp.]
MKKKSNSGSKYIGQFKELAPNQHFFSIETKEKAAYSAASSLHNSSSVTPRASASLMAVEIRPSPRASRSWMVRRGTPESSTSLGTESPWAVRISFNRIVFSSWSI